MIPWKSLTNTPIITINLLLILTLLTSTKDIGDLRENPNKTTKANYAHLTTFCRTFY